jgi:glycolate oxidase
MNIELKEMLISELTVALSEFHEKSEKFILTERDILEKYSLDETSDLQGWPDIVIRASSAQEVSSIMKICSRHSVPVIPRGAGSGVTGGAIPISGGVVISLEGMNKILEIDTENMVAVVEPGVITGDLQKAVLEKGLMYPPDPASLDICSIGGNVAEISGGPKAVKYGTTKDYVLGLQCVLSDGSIINSGGKYVKNATGYNLTGIILGSEGTLAIITKIFLKLIPAPKESRDLLIPFATLEKAIDSVHISLKNRIVPAAIEFMEEDAIKLVSGFLNDSIPFPEARAHLLIELDGESEEAVFSQIERLAEVLTVDENSILVAESQKQKEGLWKARRSIREAIHELSPVFLAEDCVVPPAAIPAFLKNLKSYLNQANLKSIMFGHAGDGNVHIDILKGDIPYEKWKEGLPELKTEIYKRAIELGGTISGEHGIGYLRKDYLSLVFSEEEIELQKRIKRAFDPQGILNPHKIF